MPSCPEFLDAACTVRKVKILHQSDAHDSRTADGDIRISGKIAVYLHGEQHGAENDARAPVAFAASLNTELTNSARISATTIFLKKADCHLLKPEKRIGSLKLMVLL